MMFYTAAINGVFVFLIAGALLFTQDQVTTEFFKGKDGLAKGFYHRNRCV